jgi:hypothetical protein
LASPARNVGGITQALWEALHGGKVTVKTLIAGTFFKSAINWLKGRDRDHEVRLENSYNQIHNATQVLDMGSTEYTDAPYTLVTKNTHALHSNFSWSGRF